MKMTTKIALLSIISLAVFGVALATIAHRSNHRHSSSHSTRPAPNARIGDPNFDVETDGEFNAVATVEALPEVVTLTDNLRKDGTVANVSVLCGDGPDHARTYWIVNVIVDYKNGKDSIVKTYRYDINTGRLAAATTEASP